MKRISLLIAAVLLLASSSFLSAKGNPDSPASVPVLLGLEPVRQDLKISSLQVALLDAIRSEYKAKVSVIAAVGLADPKLVPKAEADIRELRHRYNQRALNVLNPTQQKRLRQIERQMLGGALLTSTSEQKLLGITPEQAKKLAEIHAADKAKAAEINAKFNAGKISSFRRDIDLHRNLRTTSRSMLHVLTPEQTKQWLGLAGPKLKL
jgi:Spy/CpxP family protein refolding chaperone